MPQCGKNDLRTGEAIVVQIQEASRSELMVRMIVGAARDHGPAVFVLGASAEALLIADGIVRNRLPVELAAVGPEADVLRTHVTRLYDLDASRVRRADSLERALFGKSARIAAGRGTVGNPPPPYEYDAVHSMLKFNPLAGWTDAELHAHLSAEGIELFEPAARAYESCCDPERVAA
jgi:hypothetical protein